MKGMIGTPQDKNNDTGLTRKFNTTDITGDELTVAKHRKGGKKGKSTAGKIISAIVNTLLTLMLIGIITGIIVGTAFALYIKNYLIDDDYDITGLKADLDQTTMIYDCNGTELETQRLHGSENRSWVSVNVMPKNLKNAFVAIEDKRFYQHNGIDIRRTAGAVLEFARGNKSYGGSTITQQLIKNFTKEDDATIQRKVTEIFRAISLTKHRSKDEVLEMYLNTINLSNGCYGVEAASEHLFGKSVSELSLIECAALAAIPKSPYKYNPETHPEDNKERRDVVLDEMWKDGFISLEECTAAQQSELVLNISNGVENNDTQYVTTWFTDALIEQLISDFNEEYDYPREAALNMIYSGGLKIYATVDPEIQGIMEEAYKDPLTFERLWVTEAPKQTGLVPESAMVIMDPYTGEVKGLVGGRGEKKASRIWNRATDTKRQIGSAIKPIFVYAPAMDLGYVNYATVIDDTPVFMPNMGRYWPQNAGRGYSGKMTVNYAITQSYNTVAVKTLMKMGTNYVYNFAQEKLGITTLTESDNNVAPLSLGGLTNGLSVLEVTAAYSIFPNDGVYTAPRLYTKVLDQKGNVVLDNRKEQNVAVSAATAQIMTKIMENVVDSGTGREVTLKNMVDTAGKTGSTTDNRDIYFAGYTPYYVAAAWYGYDSKLDLGNDGSNRAMYAWDRIMKKVHEKVIERANEKGEKIKTFSTSDIVQAEYCLDSGMKPTDICKEDPRGARVAKGWFKKGSVPKKSCNIHVEVECCSEGGIATKYCPKEGREKKVFILAEDREFTQNLYIGDSDHTYRRVPANYEPPTDPSLPFFANILEEGKYAGRGSEYPRNRACTVHTAENYQPENIKDKDKDKDEDTDGEQENEGSGENEKDEENEITEKDEIEEETEKTEDGENTEQEAGTDDNDSAQGNISGDVDAGGSVEKEEKLPPEPSEPGTESENIDGGTEIAAQE